MATRLGNSMTGSLDRLYGAAFIPVRTDKDTKMYTASEVYFAPKSGDENPFKSAFTFIDFGERANLFLRTCGVKSEPSVKGESTGVAAS
jgi:hypothetical protein